MPSSNAKLRLLDHTYYQIGYSIQHKQAAYVAYLLTADMVRNNDKAKRGSTNFKKDPLLSKHYSVTQDYKNSGFVRGHLCPSKDMCWSYPSMKETFYMSNVSPQRESFNNGIWKKLENQVREWALENDSIIVITGPVLSTKYETIGENQVSVCKKFYKLVIDISYPNQKMIAFVMDNANQKGSVYKYSCTVKDVEQITDLNFFPSFESDPIIDSLEKTINIELWKSVK
jgi:endonuclease G